MWQIIINGPRYFETTLFLPKGLTAIGRAPENDIVLEGTWVSRHHAQFDVRGESLYVIDLGSRNGLLVNGSKLEGTALVHAGDLITLGEHTLTVRQPAKVENVLAPTVDLRAGGVRRLSAQAQPLPPIVADRVTGESRVLAALETLSPAEERRGDTLPKGFRSLILLGESAEKVEDAATLQAFMDEVTTWARQNLRADSAIILLKHHSGVLVPVAVKHKDGLTQGEVPVSEAVLDAALARGKVLLVDAPGTSSGTGRGKVVCAPLGPKGKPLGALYLNLTGKSDEAEVIDAADALAQLVATATSGFHRQDRGQREEKLRKTLERFHAPNILEKRVKELARAGAKPTQLEQQTITVLMADLSGFTELTERLRPERVVDILNAFYDRMAHVIFSFEGTIDKFMGDSVMAMFGAPYVRPDDPLRAVRCAFALKAEWRRAMARRAPEERCLLQVGLGTGRALVGTVGSEARLDYTAIGEPVNLASWACGAAGPDQVLVTAATLEAVNGRFEHQLLGERTVKKARRKVPMFELLEGDGVSDVTENNRPLKLR